MALGLPRDHYGADVNRSRLVVPEPAEPRALEIQVTPRVGIRACAERPLRFILQGNRFVSGPRGFVAL